MIDLKNLAVDNAWSYLLTRKMAPFFSPRVERRNFIKETTKTSKAIPNNRIGKLSIHTKLSSRTKPNLAKRWHPLEVSQNKIETNIAKID